MAIPLSAATIAGRPSRRARVRTRAWPIVVIYLLAAGLWIAFSDVALGLLVQDSALLLQLSLYKGFAFVAVTAGVLYLVLRRSFQAIEQAFARLRAQTREIERFNRLYQAFSSINHEIIASVERESLFQRTCEVLVEQGRFRMAWVGLLDAQGESLRPVASCGEGVLTVLDDLALRSEASAGSFGWDQVVRAGEPMICNDFSSDDDGSPHWRELALRHGLRSRAALPLLKGGEIIGVLSVYASEADFFRENEVALLGEVVLDVSLALEKFALEEESKRAGDALRELNETLERRVADRTCELEAAVQRAEAADRLKSAFLATMSHELRTPLNSIIGFTGILLQELAGPLNEEQARQLRMVQGSSRHLLDLINDILDLSKIEAGQLEVRTEPFDLSESLHRVVESVAPQADNKGLKLLVSEPPELPVMISDRRRFEQIVLNLLNNAIKFTDEGQIGLVLECQRGYLPPNGDPSQDALRLTVQDTGIGIREEDQANLFQPFHQLDSGLTRKHEGTGLGLMICRRLAELLGGEIRLRSEWTVGSEFTVLLPLDRSLAP